MNVAHTTHPPPIKTVFLNPSLTWTGHSHHYDYLTHVNNVYTKNTHVWYTTPPPAIMIYLLVVPYRTILGRFSKKEIRMRAGPSFQSYLGFLEFFLTLLVIKINFFLEFSCFCTFCAENDTGTTQKNGNNVFPA